MSRRSRFGMLLLLAGCLLGVSAARADGPVLHERFESDEREDLSLEATTVNGVMPAVLDTPSGVVRAPDPVAPPDESDSVYGGSSTPNSPDASYRIDRDTTRPDAVGYDDPFIPAVTPFKRLYAYDAVDSALELVVHDKTLRPIQIGGERPPGAGDDQFYADLVVDLAAGEAVRIPSVGPGARVLSVSTHPPLRFELLRDGADNWFIRSDERKRVRLVMQLAIDRAVFGSQFPDVPYRRLTSQLPPLPDAAREAAAAVIDEIGIPVTLSPTAALSALVEHFRSFAPSTDRPTSSGVALYRELALSRKGVCRHRSYAFVITAQSLGIPSRMARNEAHAWVEAFDGRIWHRVDLGGAAGRLDSRADAQRSRHAPPPDPFRWPAGSESGLDMANRALSSPTSPPTDSATLDPGPPAAPGDAGPLEPPQPEPSAGMDEDDARAASEIELSSPGGEVRRGAPFEVSGRVAADGEACSGARIDVALRSDGGRVYPLGSVPTADDGSFSGSVTVRLDVAVGDYELVVSTPGNSACGPGRL